MESIQEVEERREELIKAKKRDLIMKNYEPIPPPGVSKDDDELVGSNRDEEKKRITEESLKAYHEKTSVLIEVEPYDDTNMEALKNTFKGIEMEGLLWGATKLVPVGYGINKLQIRCNFEDKKVSIEELSEKMTQIKEHVKSVEITTQKKLKI